MSKVVELVFKDRQEMTKKMEPCACEYEGFVRGRNGYNFPNKDGSYTVAYVKGDILTKQHEMCHARYYFDPDYRSEVEKLWASFEHEDQVIIKKFLKRCGYKEEVFLDEFQAYWFTETNPRRFFGLKKTKNWGP